MVGWEEIERFCREVSDSSDSSTSADVRTSAEFRAGICYITTQYDAYSPSSGLGGAVRFNVVVTPNEIRLNRQLITDEFDISLGNKEALDTLKERIEGEELDEYYEED